MTPDTYGLFVVPDQVIDHEALQWAVQQSQEEPTAPPSQMGSTAS